MSHLRRHPNVVSYLGALDCDDDGDGGGGRCLLIFQEWAAGGSVAGIVKAFGPLPDATTARYLCHCLRGLAHLHANRVIHRDIKASAGPRPSAALPSPQRARAPTL